MAGKRAILRSARAESPRPQQRAVGHEDLAAPQVLPPFVPCQLPLAVNIDAVVADRIWQHSRRAAGGGRYSQAAIEKLIVNMLRPAAVALRRKKQTLVAGL